MLIEWQVTRVWALEPHGDTLSSESNWLDVLADAMGQQADWVAVPASRLGQNFLTLRSGLAGNIIQKFVNYRMGIAIVGDIETALAQSRALCDFVREANSGTTCWFVADMTALKARVIASCE
ncbi:DUF4180 domain-containing protein [Dyella sp.]|uniref:DUF4180 domain-containing protein n=1 Tax=Dyella sp. TaxID=1869338 RepID=UPI002ED0352F